MADTSPLAGLLDHASHVFSLADQLARAFTDEYDQQGKGLRTVDPRAWSRQQPGFNEFCNSLLELRSEMQNPPEGFTPVAGVLLEAGRVAKQIRDVLQTTDGQTWQSYLESRFHLSSVVVSGYEAIRAVTRTRRLDDPFAFVEQVAMDKDSIHTTPTLPKPPAKLIEIAGKEIPGILANISPNHDGTIELVAAHLVKQLQDSKHTLAAAHWAIHEAVRAGRLRAGLVEVGLPSVGVPNSSWAGPALQWHGGGRGTKVIPKGKPAPFDCFKVIATESLWAWWRECGAREPRVGEPLADDPRFIERLLAGPDNAKLTRAEIALLVAHLCQPIDIEILDREQRETGSSPTQAKRNKLKLIRDFNRGLEKPNTTPSNTESAHELPPVVSPVNATPDSKPNDHPALVLLRTFTNGISDDRIENATRILTDDNLTANEKLTKIDKLLPFPPTASAEQLGEMLGVSKQAILKTAWWERERKGEKADEIGRRRNKHKEQAKRRESTSSTDDDEER